MCPQHPHSFPAAPEPRAARRVPRLLSSPALAPPPPEPRLRIRPVLSPVPPSHPKPPLLPHESRADMLAACIVSGPLKLLLVINSKTARHHLHTHACVPDLQVRQGRRRPPAERGAGRDAARHHRLPGHGGPTDGRGRPPECCGQVRAASGRLPQQTGLAARGLGGGYGRSRWTVLGAVAHALSWVAARHAVHAHIPCLSAGCGSPRQPCGL